MTELEQLQQTVERLERSVAAQEKRPKNFGHHWIFVTLLALIALIGGIHLIAILSISDRIETIVIKLEPLEIVEQ